MDRLSELGTARGFAEQRVKRAEAELAEAKKELGRCVGAYIDYVKLHPNEDVRSRPRRNGKTTEYRDLIAHYHRKDHRGNCQYCAEPWPCDVYQQVFAD